MEQEKSHLELVLPPPGDPTDPDYHDTLQDRALEVLRPFDPNEDEGGLVYHAQFLVRWRWSGVFSGRKNKALPLMPAPAERMLALDISPLSLTPPLVVDSVIIADAQGRAPAFVVHKALFSGLGLLPIAWDRTVQGACALYGKQCPNRTDESIPQGDWLCITIEYDS